MLSVIGLPLLWFVSVGVGSWLLVRGSWFVGVVGWLCVLWLVVSLVVFLFLLLFLW